MKLLKTMGTTSLHRDKIIILGVIKDFNFRLKDPIAYAIISRRLAWRARGRGCTGSNQGLRHIKYANNTPFSCNFLTVIPAACGRTFGFLSPFFVSCTGLFGLAIHTAQVKTRKIGIRKSAGCMSTRVQLISKDF